MYEVEKRRTNALLFRFFIKLLDAPILSQSTNQARRGSRKRPTRLVNSRVNQAGEARVRRLIKAGKCHCACHDVSPHHAARRVAADFLLNLIAYNLIRIPKLLAA